MKAVVAGHLCLDILPGFGTSEMNLTPGTLAEVGPATLACGGAVANVGQALIKLGVETELNAKLGDDPFGLIVQELLGDAGSALRPDSDADLLYFGYPPLMRGIYGDEGAGLAAAFEDLRSRGVTTVLDMAMPDPGGPSGAVDRAAFLRTVLPHTDFFLPSLEETCFMLRREVDGSADGVAAVAERVLDLGARVVGLKLGADGVYLRGRANAPAGRPVKDAAAWLERELWMPVFEAEVKGTTGAGDATIAGFVRALLAGSVPEECLEFAVAVGAMSVEQIDATSGVGSHAEVRARLAAGWRHAPHEVGEYWHPGPFGAYFGPHDGGTSLR